MAAAAHHLVARLAAAGGVDVIHAQQLLPDGLAAVLLGRRLGRPVVCTLRGEDAERVPFHDPLARAAARAVVRGAAAFTAVSQGLIASLDRLGPRRAHAGGGANGATLALPADRARDAPAPRPYATPLFLFAVLLIARNVFYLLVDAFARVRPLLPRRVSCSWRSEERDDLSAGHPRQSAARGFVGASCWPAVFARLDATWLAAADVLRPEPARSFPNVFREGDRRGTRSSVSALPGVAEIVTPECGTCAAGGRRRLTNALAARWRSAGPRCAPSSRAALSLGANTEYYSRRAGRRATAGAAGAYMFAIAASDTNGAAVYPRRLLVLR